MAACEPGAQIGSIHQKNQWQKISCNCLLNSQICVTQLYLYINFCDTKTYGNLDKVFNIPKLPVAFQKNNFSQKDTIFGFEFHLQFYRTYFGTPKPKGSFKSEKLLPHTLQDSGKCKLGQRTACLARRYLYRAILKQIRPSPPRPVASSPRLTGRFCSQPRVALNNSIMSSPKRVRMRQGHSGRYPR